MSRWSWAYVLTVIALAAGCAAAALWTVRWSADELWTLLALACLATLAQTFRADGPNHMAFFATPVFFFAGVLLLTPGELVILVIVPHLIEWAHARLVQDGVAHLHAWYIQPFNIAMYVLAVLAGQQAHGVLLGALPADGQALSAASALGAAAVYLIVNQAILGQVLVLARGVSWRDSGVLRAQNLLPEFAMLCLAIVVAKLWQLDPWLVMPALTPLVLIYRALKVPQLQQAAQLDSKTGLYNAGHLRQRFEEELERARRFDRPLSVLMADLDLLRNINNSFGHLAGDAVLEGVGKVIRRNVRQYDIAGRFGGEEFSLILPETDQAYAYELAERIRREVEATEFQIPNGDAPIRVSISVGVASYPENGVTLNDLVNEADVAMYQAKYQGRNRVVRVSDIPQSVKLERALREEQVRSEYAAAFRRAAALPSSAGRAAAPAAAAAPPGPTTFLLVGGVVALGLAATAAGVRQAGASDLTALALLVCLAVAAEWLQINVYGQHSISVSMSMIVAAAMIAGMPGLALVSLAVVLANQLRRGRGWHEWYKVAFNWGAHVIAGLAPLGVGRLLSWQLEPRALVTMVALTAAASLAYYVVETALIAAAIGLQRGESAAAVWRAQFRWLAPHYVVLGMSGLFLCGAYLAIGVPGMLFFALPVLMQRYAQVQYVARTNASVQELRRMNAELSSANHEVVEASGSIHELNARLRLVNSELFRTVGMILDVRDPYVAGHSLQVAHYASAIAAELGQPPERVELVYHAALLHDIGKIAVPEHILNKPGKLTYTEYERLKEHTVIGAELLVGSPALRHLAPLIRHHHERWDGNGYPDRLRAEEIPLEARILAVCDAVEAMASDRPYRTAEPLEVIIAELRRGSGTQFETQVVEAFIRLVERNGPTFVVNSARAVEQRTGRGLSGAPDSGRPPTPPAAEIHHRQEAESSQRVVLCCNTPVSPGGYT